MMVSQSNREESIVGKGENAVPTMFSKALFFKVFNSPDCVVEN